MGSGRTYNPQGGVYREDWSYQGESYDNIKVIYNKIDSKTNGLPLYSNTSDAYLKKMKGSIVQLRLYKNRIASIDIDIEQSGVHTNKDGTKIQGTIAHVHEWGYNKRGEWVRGITARLLTESEIKKWGRLLKEANPNIKFKP